MCLAGAVGAGAELLAAMPTADLCAYYVWVPMLPSDDRNAALAAAHRFSAPRAAHYWDSRRHFSRRMAMTLGIDTRRSTAPGDESPFAWDVYLAYRRGNVDIAQPDFCMHQLTVEHAPRFDATEWRSQIERLVTEFR